MLRFICACALLSATSALTAAPVPTVPAEPLPGGATARLGTKLFLLRGFQHQRPTFSADGRKLIVSSATEAARDKPGLTVFDADTGKALAHRLTPPVGLDRFRKVHPISTPDRIVWLASAGDQRDLESVVVVTDLDGQESNRFEVASVPHFAAVYAPGRFGGVVVSPTGRYLAVRFGPAFTAYDLGTGKQVLTEKIDAKSQTRVCIPTGTETLFVNTEGKPVRRFDLATGKELLALDSDSHEIDHLAASTDGKWLVTHRMAMRPSQDGHKRLTALNELDVRDGTTGKVLGRLDLDAPPHELAFVSKDSILVGTARSLAGPAVGLETGVSRWNVATRKREWQSSQTGVGMVLSPDNKQFAAIHNQRLRVYDAGSGTRLSPEDHSGPVDWIGFSTDTKTVSTAGSGEVITRAISGQHQKTVPVPELFRATSRWGGEHLVWLAPAQDEQQTTTLYGWGAAGAIGWRISGEPFGRFAAGLGERAFSVRTEAERSREVVTVYDGPTGKKVNEWSYQRPAATARADAWPRSVSSNGRFLIVGGDSPVLILDTESGKELGRVATDSSNVREKNDFLPTLAVAADASKLAIRSRTKVEVYDVKTGKVLAQHDLKEDAPGGSSSVRTVNAWCFLGGPVRRRSGQFYSGSSAAPSPRPNP